VRAFNHYREERALNRSVPLTPDPATPRNGTVIINEVFYRDGDYIRPGDWIELANVGDGPVNLAGWSIRDTQDRNLFVLGTRRSLRGFIVLTCDPEAFEWTYLSLPDPPQALYFGLPGRRDPQTVELSWQHEGLRSIPTGPPWPTEPADGGWSLFLISPDGNKLPNLLLDSNPGGGTPGLSKQLTPPWTHEAALFLSGVSPNPAFDLITYGSPPRPGAVRHKAFLDLARGVVAVRWTSSSARP
jgi:hypothetical protein